MDYRKTSNRKGCDYYRIDLDGGDQDPDFDTLPKHWQEACWHLEGEDKKSNRDWPAPLYTKEVYKQDKTKRMGYKGTDNCLFIYWNNDDGEYYLTWHGPTLEELKT